ncbi:transient receptor potential cation channel protein painless-like [Schistocerca americana]|uniref:transient receptor potential cation channel protein painless-like n=1 Tax=Schistocerca americana TaxID=7009 RepID=UPI001F503724|nr:transient receptor potential cation channel protein painless-like [Schistocerca americana]
MVGGGEQGSSNAVTEEGVAETPHEDAQRQPDNQKTRADHKRDKKRRELARSSHSVDQAVKGDLPGYGASPENDQQRRLLEALETGDLPAFQELLKSGTVDPIFRYKPPFFKKFGTCLEIACRTDGRAAFVQALLNNGVRPNNIILPEPIHYAAKHGQADSLEALLGHSKTRVNATDAAERTALHLVAEHFHDSCEAERAEGYRRCVELLMALPDFHVNGVDSRGFTAAHAAAHYKNRLAFTAILDKCREAGRTLDLDKATPGGHTARQLAQKVFPDVSLPGAGLPQDDAVEELLSALSEGESARCRQLLVAAAAWGFDANLWLDEPLGMRLLEAACRLPTHRSTPDFVRVTLAAGADPNAINLKTHRTALHVAAEEGNVAVLDCLLEDESVDINAQDRDGVTPLMLAVEAAELDCVERLLARSDLEAGKVDARGRTVLHYAALAAPTDDGVDCLRQLLERRDLHPAVPDAEGHKPADVAADLQVRQMLEEACSRRSPPLLVRQKRSMLISQQTSPWQRYFDLLVIGDYESFIKDIDELGEEGREILDNKSGQYTLLQFAVIRGQCEVVKALLDKGADPNCIGVSDKHASPPLVMASFIASKGKDSVAKKIITLLLQTERTDVNASNVRGYTALHFASRNADLNTVVELLNRGANMRAKSSFGEYPLSAANVDALLNNSLSSTDNCLPTHLQYVIKFDFSLLLTDVRSSVPPPFAKIFHRDTKDPEKALLESEKRIGAPTRRLYSEMRFLRFLSHSEEHEEVLHHPVIKAFLHLKYKRITWLLRLNFILYFTYVLAFSSFIWVQYSNTEKRGTTAWIVLNVLTYVSLVPIAVREIFQMFHPKSYFRNVQNYKDMLMLSGTVFTLIFTPQNGIGMWWTTLTIILSWFELLWLCGRFQRHAMYVEMFRTVLRNYTYFFTIFSLIILGFSFSFYVVFSSDRTTIPSNDTTVDTVHYFSHPLFALFKIVNMMAGDMAPDITLNLDVVLACFVVTLFMFFLPIVLLNLLTALAVSDEQKIRENAEILSLKSQIDCLYEMEKIASRHYEITKALKLKFLYDRLRKVWLFQKGSEKTRLEVWPNKGQFGKLVSELSGEKRNTPVSGTIDMSLIEEAKQLLAERPILSEKEGFEQLHKLVEQLKIVQMQMENYKVELENAKKPKRL